MQYPQIADDRLGRFFDIDYHALGFKKESMDELRAFLAFIYEPERVEVFNSSEDKLDLLEDTVNYSPLQTMLQFWLSLLVEEQNFCLLRLDLTLYDVMTEEEHEKVKDDDRYNKYRKNLSIELRERLIAFYFNRKERLKGEIMTQLILALNTLIEIGNKHRIWKLCFVNSITVSVLPSHPLYTKRFEKNKHLLKQDKRIRRSQITPYKHALHIEKMALAFESRLGVILENHACQKDAILFSLMIHSYILDGFTLKKVMETIGNRDSLKTVGAQWMVSVPTSKYNPARKVLISPITRFIVERYAQSSHPDFKWDLNDNFSSAFFDLLNVKQYLYPKEFILWFNPVYYYLHMQGLLPGMALNYLTKTDRAYSLKGNRFEQIVLNQTNMSSQLTFEDDEIAIKATIKYRYFSSNTDWPEAMRYLDQSRAGNTTLTRIHKQLSLLMQTGHLSKNEILLIEWARELLLKPDRTGLSPNKILSRIRNLIGKIVTILDDESMLELDETERLDCFNHILDLAISEKNYAQTLYNLKQFNYWLEHTKNRPPLRDYSIFAEASEDSSYSVNANILSIDDYLAAQKTLDDITPNFFLHKEILKLTFAMGYRMGLRASEIRFLEKKDLIQMADDWILQIQENDTRGLKTENAQRFMRVKEHFNDHEIQLLLNYLDQAQTHPAYAHNPFLFCNHDETLELSNQNVNRKRKLKPLPISEDELFVQIMAIVRQVSKDTSLKFHQCRHSFASFELLSMFDAQFSLNIGRLYFSHQPETQKWMETSCERWHRRLNLDNNFTSAPYWLHQKIGHGSIYMTLGHYCHLMDLTIGAFQMQKASALLTKQLLVEELKLFSTRTFYRIKNSNFKDLFDTPSVENENSDKAGECDAQEPYREGMQSDPKLTAEAIQFFLKEAKLLADVQLENKLMEFESYYWHQSVFTNKTKEQVKKEDRKKKDFALVKKIFKDYPKLIFKPIVNNQRRELIGVLNALHYQYSFSNRQANRVKQFIGLFIRKLKVKYDTNEYDVKYVKQFNLQVQKAEEAAILINFLKLYNLSIKFILIAPKYKTGKLEDGDFNIQSRLNKNALAYWAPESNGPIFEVIFERMQNPNGQLRIIILNPENSSKLHAFYAAVKLFTLDVLISEK